MVSGNAVLVQSPGMLCRILQFAVECDGVEALLQFTHVSARWRPTAFGNSSPMDHGSDGAYHNPTPRNILAHAPLVEFIRLVSHCVVPSGWSSSSHCALAYLGGVHLSNSIRDHSFDRAWVH